jgi:hypothetical protein
LGWRDLEATSVLEGPARPHDASYEILRDHYAAELPPGYDLILESTSERVCLTAKGPGLRERECVDVAPDAAERSSLFRRLAATAKLYARVRRGTHD